MSKLAKILLSTGLILGLLVILLINLRLTSSEDTWIKQDGGWVKHGNPSSPAPTEESFLKQPNSEQNNYSQLATADKSLPSTEKAEAQDFNSTANYLDPRGKPLLPLFVTKTSPVDNSLDVPLNQTIKIQLSRLVSRNLILPQITPEIPGNFWYQNKAKRGYLYQTLVFKADQVFNPQTNYTVKLKGTPELNGVNESFNFELNFKTQPLPKVASAKLDREANQVIVKLDRPNPGLVKFDFNLEPPLEFTTKLNQTKDQFTLILKKQLDPQIQYQFQAQSEFIARDRITNEIVLEAEANPVFETRFQIATPAEILDYEPKGNQVLPNAGIRILFDQPMQTASVENNFTIEPGLEGVFSWSPDRTEMKFRPAEKMPINTNFTVTLNKAALNELGEELSSNFRFSFKTLARLKITSYYPRNKARGLSVTTAIKFYFDKPIDQTSARENFQISPQASGTFYFPNSTTLVFKPNKLAYKKTYRVTISGVRTAYETADFAISPISGPKESYILYSAPRTFRFTTKGHTLKLSAPMDYQDKPLSCEAAALKMALARKGKRVSENSIMARVLTDATPRRGNIWGNPYSRFVGNIYGRQNSTGYGVYWPPIERAARVWRPRSRDFSKWSVNRLMEEIRQGNLVVVWGTMGSWATRDSWHTRGGRHINAWVGEHTRTVVGFVNGPNSPSKIIVHDPIAGVIYWSTSSFVRDWNKFGRKGVVVR